MQLMNGWTVLILCGFLHLIIAITGLLIRSENELRPIIRLWIGAQLLVGSTQLLRLLRDVSPVFFGSTLPNAATSLGYGLMLIALARLFKLPERSLWWTTITLTLVHLVLRELGLQEPNRLAWLGVMLAIQYAQFVHLYGASSRRNRSRLLITLQYTNLLVVLTMLARSVEAAGAHASYDFQHAGIGQVLSLIGVFVGAATNGIGFLLILIERGIDELTRLSTLDSLTETLNRRSLLQHGRQQLALANRAVHPISVSICDIDHFKQINDQYGHHVGDDVICALVAVARNTMRDSDSIARWGGEEFVLLLPRTTLDGARQLAERLRQSFALREVRCGEQVLRNTVSIGVAEYRPSEDLQQTIDRADAALLRAKQAGRDRVITE
jgi:diguanylate cyclase (GGDEF)-like protein